MSAREFLLLLVLALALFNVAALIYFWRQDHQRAPRRNVIDIGERRRARDRGLEAIRRASMERQPW